MKNVKLTLSCALTIAFSAGGIAMAAVNITSDVAGVTVQHGEQSVEIKRNQNQNNTIKPTFAKTSRQCPPFCIQPATLAPGVETIGELEIIDYIKRMSDGDSSIMVIDSRTSDWVSKGTIPGAVNIPWTSLNQEKGADPISIGGILQESFNAQNMEGLWDYSNAKTLVLFGNGMWSGQSSSNIMNLLKFGYPADKLKWYRGGIQSWEILGLNTIKP